MRKRHERAAVRKYRLRLCVWYFALLTGCATPAIQPADPRVMAESELLSFIRDGTTTREEVLLQLGMPAAQMEGERILMYQLRPDEAGELRLTAPGWDMTSGVRVWGEGTCSLVLVFAEDGMLRRHSLVMAR